MTCGEFSLWLEEYFADWPGSVPAGSEEHVAICPACRSQWEALRSLELALALARDVPPPAGLADRVLAAWQRELSADLTREPRLRNAVASTPLVTTAASQPVSIGSALVPPRSSVAPASQPFVARRTALGRYRASGALLAGLLASVAVFALIIRLPGPAAQSRGPQLAGQSTAASQVAVRSPVQPLTPNNQSTAVEVREPVQVGELVAQAGTTYWGLVEETVDVVGDALAVAPLPATGSWSSNRPQSPPNPSLWHGMQEEWQPLGHSVRSMWNLLWNDPRPTDASTNS